MRLQVSAEGLGGPWTGSLEDLVSSNPDLPDFCVRRLETLIEGDQVRFPFGPHLFIFRRLTATETDLS